MQHYLTNQLLRIHLLLNCFRRLEGIDLFLIGELFIQFPGATTTIPSQTDFRYIRFCDVISDYLYK